MANAQIGWHHLEITILCLILISIVTPFRFISIVIIRTVNLLDTNE